MEGLNVKFVEFAKFCKQCKNYNVSPTADPCNECLGVPARLGTRKPEKFEEKDNGNRQ